MATVHVLGNPAAGGGRAPEATAAVVAAVRAAGHDVEVLGAPRRADVAIVLRDALAAGATRVVVAGGDGLAHLALQSVAGTDVVVGLVPVGTGNDLARGLGLPLDDLAAAVERALAPGVALDALRTTHGWVASVATLGFAAAVNERANALRRPRGSARYTVATLLRLPGLRSRRLRLEVDDEVHELTCTLVAIANTAYFGGGMEICPQADARDGHMDVALVGDVGRFTLLRFFPQVFSGRHVTHPAVTMLRGRCVRITALDHDDPHGLWGDGEPVGALPIEIEAVPGAWHVAGAQPT